MRPTNPKRTRLHPDWLPQRSRSSYDVQSCQRVQLVFEHLEFVQRPIRPNQSVELSVSARTINPPSPADPPNTTLHHRALCSRTNHRDGIIMLFLIVRVLTEPDRNPRAILAAILLVIHQSTCGLYDSWFLIFLSFFLAFCLFDCEASFLFFRERSLNYQSMWCSAPLYWVPSQPNGVQSCATSRQRRSCSVAHGVFNYFRFSFFFFSFFRCPSAKSTRSNLKVRSHTTLGARSLKHALDKGLAYLPGALCLTHLGLHAQPRYINPRGTA